MIKKNIDLNRKCVKIYGDIYVNYIKYRQDRIQDSVTPMNEIMWYQGGFVLGEKHISVSDLRYGEYTDIINQSVKPFKKKIYD